MQRLIDGGIHHGASITGHPSRGIHHGASIAVRQWAGVRVIDKDWLIYVIWISGEKAVPNSVLEAIKMGIWDFEPEEVDDGLFDSTIAMPGTDEKVGILADRVRNGLPLWHSRDRMDYDEVE